MVAVVVVVVVAMVEIVVATSLSASIAPRRLPSRRPMGVATPVTTCFASSVDGADLLEVTQGVLVKEVRLTPLKDLRA